MVLSEEKREAWAAERHSDTSAHTEEPSSCTGLNSSLRFTSVRGWPAVKVQAKAGELQ